MEKELTSKEKANQKYRLTHKEYYSNYYKEYRKNHKQKNYNKVYKQRLDDIIDYIDAYKKEIDVNYILEIANGKLDRKED